MENIQRGQYTFGIICLPWKLAGAKLKLNFQTPFYCSATFSEAFRRCILLKEPSKLHNSVLWYKINLQICSNSLLNSGWNNKLMENKGSISIAHTQAHTHRHTQTHTHASCFSNADELKVQPQIQLWLELNLQSVKKLNIHKLFFS